MTCASARRVDAAGSSPEGLRVFGERSPEDRTSQRADKVKNQWLACDAPQKIPPALPRSVCPGRCGPASDFQTR
jgi:hypothetical protein